MIAGWEEGFTGQCAGERVTMVVPPSLGYGNQASDKVTVAMLMVTRMKVEVKMMVYTGQRRSKLKSVQDVVKAPFRSTNLYPQSNRLSFNVR